MPLGSWSIDCEACNRVYRFGMPEYGVPSAMFSMKRILLIIAGIACLLSLSLAARRDTSMANLFLWLSPILFGLTMGMECLPKNGKLWVVSTRATFASLLASLVVGWISLSDHQIRDRLDPGAYYLGTELYVAWILPFHCLATLVFAASCYGLVRLFLNTRF
jgi:hypothetical protein